MTRQKARKLERKGRCRTYWGSHGCHKPAGHMGRHFCANGCPQPELGAPVIQQDAAGAAWVRAS